MGVQFSEVIERMKRAANLKNDSRVARTLGVTPQAISNYKKRGAIPADLILRFADLYGLSVDWLVTGEGEPYRPGYEGKVIPPMSAAEGMAPYGGYGKGLKGLADFAALAPEEIIYVGKLIKVMREGDKSAVSVIKWSVDAFLKAIDAARIESVSRGESEGGGDTPAEGS